MDIGAVLRRDLAWNRALRNMPVLVAAVSAVVLLLFPDPWVYIVGFGACLLLALLTYLEYRRYTRFRISYSTFLNIALILYIASLTISVSEIDVQERWILHILQIPAILLIGLRIGAYLKFGKLGPALSIVSAVTLSVVTVFDALRN